MRNRQKIKELEQMILELRSHYSELAYKMDYPPLFKEGDKISIDGQDCVINSSELELRDRYNGWITYTRFYKVIHESRIFRISESELTKKIK